MARIFIRNFGCCANYNNGEIMAGILKKDGHCLAKSMEEADLIIINTCIAKQTTEDRVRHVIEEAIRRNKKLVIGGCLPEADYNLCKSMAKNASLLNTFHVTKIGDIVRLAEEGKTVEFIGKRKEVKNCFPVLRQKDNVGNIQISEGCLGSCSFCVVKRAKGDLVSFPPGKIIADFRKAINEGCNTINITSQDNATYGIDFGGQQLPSLLWSLLKFGGDYTIRVGMMNPKHAIKIMDELIGVYNNKKIKKFLHIPVQSGSNKVLREMGRDYRVEDFKGIVRKFREKVEGVVISTDIIVGYPTETEEDFNKTIELIREIKPEVINISRFGSRPGTVASMLKPLPTQEVKRRSRILALLFQEQKKKA